MGVAVSVASSECSIKCCNGCGNISQCVAWRLPRSVSMILHEDNVTHEDE